MNRSKTITLVAAISMFAAVSCGKDDKKKGPTPAKTVEAPVEKTAKATPEKAPEKAAPTAAAQIDQMVAGCEASADARTARHADKPLYERLGGHDPIMAVTKKIIELHVANDSPIKDLFKDVDLDKLAEHVVNFVGAGTGGPEKYTGRNMKDAHADLKLTPEQFLAAGGDIMEALAEFKVPANEAEEFMCIILSFKDDVVAM